MPSTYTPRLRLTLPATGENSGTWGTLVNTGITDLIDAAIAGYASVAMTDADYTLTSVNGAADQARQMMLNMTGTLTAARNVICPTTSKLYVIKNSTTGGFGITLKTASGTGVLIPNGSSALLMCDGTNVVESDTHASTLTIGTTAANTYGGKLVVYAGDTVFADALTASGASAPRIGSATQALVIKTNTGAGSASEVARFDGSGNLGLGTASPLSTAGYTALTLNNTTGSIFSMQVAGVEKARLQAYASELAVSVMDTAPMTFRVNGTEIFRANNSGSLLVNKFITTKTEKLGVKGTGATTPPTNLSSMNGALILVESNQADTAYGAVGYQDNTGGGAAVVFGRGSSYQTQIAFYTNPLSNAVDGGMRECGRFDSDGNLLVGTSAPLIGSARKGISVLAPTGSFVPACFSNDAGFDAAVVEMWNKATTTNNVFAHFFTEGTATLRGAIDYNRAGGLVAYNTTSDYRAKDILGSVQSPGATIDALAVYEGRMKGATQSRPMLIAHEAQAVAPYCVTGEKDAINEDGTPKFQQMDVSSLVPLLIAEIQELRARVAALEA